MKLTHKLLAGFIIVGAFVVLTGIIGIVATGIIGDKVELVTQVTTPTVKAVDGLMLIAVQANKVMHAYAAEYGDGRLEFLRREFDQLNDEFDEAERTARRLIEDQLLIDTLNKATKKYDGVKDKAEKIILNHKAEIAESDDLESARYAEVTDALLKQLDDDTDESIEFLQEIAEEVDTLNRAADTDSINAVRNTSVITLFVTVIGVCFAIGIGIFFTRLFMKPMNELTEAAKRVSEGNFDVKVKEPKSHDEMHQLTNTFNKMVSSLRSMVEESPRLKQFMQVVPSAEKVVSSKEQYELAVGNSYVLREHDSRKAFSIFVDKVTHGYQGLCISRTNPALLKRKYGLQKTPILWLSDAKEGNTFSTSDLLIIGKLMADFLSKSKQAVILLDRVDYLIAKHGFDEVLKFIVKINDKVMVSNAILLVPVDQSLMKAKELSFLAKEMVELHESEEHVEVPADLKEIVEFVDTRRRLGEQVTFKEIGQHFNITAPTTQKRVSDLQQRGLLNVMKHGRMKIVVLTEKAVKLLH